MNTKAMLEISGGRLPAESKIGGTNVNSFQISSYLVTIAQWEGVRNWAMQNGFVFRVGRAGGQSPLPWDGCSSPGNSAGPNYPVTEINWYDALKWCNAKSLIDGLDPVYILKSQSDCFRSGEIGSEDAFHFIECCPEANGYRLPTDAEWEWAARGGCQSQGFTYAGSNDLSQVGWYEGNSHGQVHPVGMKTPNELGLYDMSGNVQEWIWGLNIIADDRIPTHRGGSWNCSNKRCEVYRRFFGNPNYFATTMGLRLAKNT